MERRDPQLEGGKCAKTLRGQTIFNEKDMKSYGKSLLFVIVASGPANHGNNVLCLKQVTSDPRVTIKQDS